MVSLCQPIHQALGQSEGTPWEIFCSLYLKLFSHYIHLCFDDKEHFIVTIVVTIAVVT